MDKREREQAAIDLLIRALARDRNAEFHIACRPEEDKDYPGTYNYVLTDGCTKIAVEIFDLFRHDDYGRGSQSCKAIHAQYEKLRRDLQRELREELPGRFILCGALPKGPPPKRHRLQPVLDEIRSLAACMHLYKKERLSSLPLDLFKWCTDGHELHLGLWDPGHLQQPWDVKRLLLRRNRKGESLLAHEDGQLKDAPEGIRILAIQDLSSDTDAYAVQLAIGEILHVRPDEVRYASLIYYLSAKEARLIWPHHA